MQSLQEVDASAKQCCHDTSLTTTGDILTHLKEISRRKHCPVIGMGLPSKDLLMAFKQEEKTRKPLRKHLYFLMDKRSTLARKLSRYLFDITPEGFDDDREAWERFAREMKEERWHDDEDEHDMNYGHEYIVRCAPGPYGWRYPEYPHS